MKRDDFPPTDAELREQYERTGLARIGMSFERAMTSEAVRIALAGAVRGRRRLAARQAQSAAINFQNQEAA